MCGVFLVVGGLAIAAVGLAGSPWAAVLLVAGVVLTRWGGHRGLAIGLSDRYIEASNTRRRDMMREGRDGFVFGGMASFVLCELLVIHELLNHDGDGIAYLLLAIAVPLIAAWSLEDLM